MDWETVGYAVFVAVMCLGFLYVGAIVVARVWFGARRQYLRDVIDETRKEG